ncbi:FAD-binding oxidoreductase [Bradymonas sediminis]|uniref:Uncharacterized protein n=1 Tax=Bradymonas sediminis TaxID=1548548 RepID=A0A2Z4FPM1_9DELT|nr:FAD-binding protein [Bradymonas sediminis]AWV90967.1 hypothetical protein DN745_17195 [Bradymonas sediminis]TDP75294.1 FAD binding domain-containing protein [Bradymonas sediminis]
MRKTTFYKARHLPEPVEEYWPADSDALANLLTDEPGEVGRVIFGGGQHIRPQLVAGRPFEAIRTDNCHRILHLDRESGLVTVEAGIRWGDLREKLREDGYSLRNYRPYPDAASIGGLLAKHSPSEPYWLVGDIREGCVALSAVSPKLGEYRYLEAPRKAAGPDLRHLFMGGEGVLGTILDVTLSVQKPLPARQLVWAAPTAGDAVGYLRALSACDIRPNWCYWKRSAAEFYAIIHAPTRLLDAMVDRIENGLLTVDSGADFQLPEIKGDEEARDFRQELEWDMPEQRSRRAAPRTLALTYSMANLGPALDALSEATEVEIMDFSNHAATAYVAFKDVETSRAFLASEQARLALDARPIIAPLDPKPSPILWPEWSEALKDEFDPKRRLTMGPQ